MKKLHELKPHEQEVVLGVAAQLFAGSIARGRSYAPGDPDDQKQMRGAIDLATAFVQQWSNLCRGPVTVADAVADAMDVIAS